MLANQREEELLIITKTYPGPSTKYRETACVAALTRSGEMRRLFPVPFRFLSGEARFKKWEWIRGVVRKSNNDHRPESSRLDVDSIQKLGEEVSTRDNWRLRREWIAPHLSESFAALEARRLASGETLGFIRPFRLLGLDITPLKNPNWTDKERINLTQEVLFETEASRQRPPLRKLPLQLPLPIRVPKRSGNNRAPPHDHRLGSRIALLELCPEARRRLGSTFSGTVRNGICRQGFDFPLWHHPQVSRPMADYRPRLSA